MIEDDKKENYLQHFDRGLCSFSERDLLDEFRDPEDTHEFQQTQEFKESETWDGIKRYGGEQIDKQTSTFNIVDGYHFGEEDLIAIRIKIGGSEIKNDVHEEEEVDQIVEEHDHKEFSKLRLHTHLQEA